MLNKTIDYNKSNIRTIGKAIKPHKIINDTIIAIISQIIFKILRNVSITAAKVVKLFEKNKLFYFRKQFKGTNILNRTT